MTNSITSNKMEYPGDKAFSEFLIAHKCPLSFHVVKFRFWGQLVSIAIRVSPTDGIQRFWNDNLPAFDNDDETQSFFDTIFSLWNGLSEINMAGTRLKLSMRQGLDNVAGLKAMIEQRLDELDAGFLSGFIGDMTAFDREDPKTSASTLKLTELIDAIENLQADVYEGNISYEMARKEFLKLDKSAQRILDNVVKAANAQRKIKGGTETLH